MTARAHTITRVLVWSVPGLLLVMIVWGLYHPAVFIIRHKNHVSQISQIGLALKLYADDNQGALPQRLEDMMPIYFTKRELLDGVEYVTPGAKLPDLSPTAVIARRQYPEDHWVSEVHADGTAEAHKP